MTRTPAFVFSLILAAGSALAEGPITEPQDFIPTASRAEVREAMQQHRIAGAKVWADDYDHLADFRGSLTRAEVVAGFMGARQSVAAFHGEDSGSTYLAQMQAPEGASAIVVARAR